MEVDLRRRKGGLGILALPSRIWQCGRGFLGIIHRRQFRGKGRPPATESSRMVPILDAQVVARLLVQEQARGVSY